MDTVVLTMTLIGILVALGVVADHFGIDTRDTYGDDWARPTHH